MDLSQQQIQQISSRILISDIKEYIDSHQQEYQEFLESKITKQ